MSERRYDLVILGSGSTAFAAALRAQELGKTAAMTEVRSVGGTCVNRGCIPSKNLIEAARILFEARHPRYPGLGGKPLDFDFRELIRQKDELVAEYRAKKYESLVGGSIELHHGQAVFVAPNAVDVGGMRLVGERILIATGSRPAPPPIPGLEDAGAITSDLLTSGEPTEMTELPESMLVIGGGYVALELGQMFSRFGVRVTMVERSATLLAHGYEPELGPAVAENLRAEGIDVRLSSETRSARRDGDEVVASVSSGGRTDELRAKRLLVATGRRPNTDAVAISRAGVRVGASGEVLVDRYLRTNVSPVFAAGDVVLDQVGSQMATPVGAKDGGIAAHNALSTEPPREVDHRVIPRAIFTDPPIGLVGVTEAEAIAAGRRCWCGTIPMSVVPRAGAVRDARGFAKMVADDETGEVLGVTMMGRSAEEVVHEAAMAMRFRAKVGDFADMLHVYPTMAEALKIVAISRRKDPRKLSCCAE